jgi:hypothetical protein
MVRGEGGLQGAFLVIIGAMIARRTGSGGSTGLQSSGSSTGRARRRQGIDSQGWWEKERMGIRPYRRQIVCKYLVISVDVAFEVMKAHAFRGREFACPEYLVRLHRAA